MGCPAGAAAATALGVAALAIAAILLSNEDGSDDPAGDQEDRDVTSDAPTAEDILMPGGEPIGEPGTGQDVRELPGGTEEAEDLVEAVAGAIGAEPIEGTDYPGKLFGTPEGEFVGVREEATSPGAKATVDVNIPGIPFDEIKFK